jgi:hypothetical protein
MCLAGCGYAFLHLTDSPTSHSRPKGTSTMAWFYEIRSSTNAVLKRDGGFPTQDAAKIAGREDAKRMKNSHQPNRPDVGRIMVGQNAEKATRVAQPLGASGPAFETPLNFRVAAPSWWLFEEAEGLRFPALRTYPPFFSSARTSLATSRSVSNTPWPVMATASFTGSPFTCSCLLRSWTERTPGRSRLLSCRT